jgi:endonuclease YncB( thermonuclease family)
MFRLVAIAALLVLTAGAAITLSSPRPSAVAAEKDCSDFPNQAAAQRDFTSHGGSPTNNFDDLDADHDGLACESLPCPCSAAAGGRAGAGNPIPQASRLRARAIEAVDGDTLKVKLRGSGSVLDVRLIGIDTPETRRPGIPIECGGPQASASMHRLADRRRVTLITDPSQDRIDRYGRLLAYAIRRDGFDLDLAQLRRGWAEVYVYEHNPFRRVRGYRRAQGAARRAGRGVWGLCGGDFHTPAQLSALPNL